MKRAYKVEPDVMEECVSCHDYSLAGYMLHTVNPRVESELFVCEECYREKYSSEYPLGERKKEEPKGPKLSERILACLEKWNGWARSIRYVAIAMMAMIVTASGIKESPDYREIQRRAMEAWRHVDQIEERVEGLGCSLEKIGKKLSLTGEGLIGLINKNNK